MTSPTTVLVTGSSSGFGFLICQTLVAKGHRVYATMREPEGRNASKATALREAGTRGPGSLEVLELDVTSEDSIGRAVARIHEQGELDVAINNAGYGTMSFNETYDMAQFQRLFDVDVFGVQRVNRAVLPRMRERGRGLLIHVSSGLGRFVLPFVGPYAAAKYALEALAEGYRYDLARLGVDVTIVEPGAFATNFMAAADQPADAARLAGYAALAETASDMWKPIADILSGPYAPQPQLVADAVAEIIATPAGQRKLRWVVDPISGMMIEQINEFMHGIQTSLLANMEIPDLAGIKG